MSSTHPKWTDCRPLDSRSIDKKNHINQSPWLCQSESIDPAISPLRSSIRTFIWFSLLIAHRPRQSKTTAEMSLCHHPVFANYHHTHIEQNSQELGYSSWCVGFPFPRNKNKTRICVSVSRHHVANRHQRHPSAGPPEKRYIIHPTNNFAQLYFSSFSFLDIIVGCCCVYILGIYNPLKPTPPQDSYISVGRRRRRTGKMISAAALRTRESY